MLLFVLAAGCGDTVVEAPEPVPAAPAAAAIRVPDDVAEEAAATPPTEAARSTAAPPPEVTECPEGVIAAPGWPGEYPEPIAHVTEALQVPSRSHPCGPSTGTCELAPGLLHPWNGASDQTFVTVRAVERWHAAKAFQLGTQQLVAGDPVRLTQEIGEGFCAYERAGVEFQAQCPALLKGKLAVQPAVERATEQLVQVPCADGTAAWVAVDDELMARAEVRPGAFDGYGAVGPAPR